MTNSIDDEYEINIYKTQEFVILYQHRLRAVWQIWKCFSGTFYQAQTLKLGVEVVLCCCDVVVLKFVTINLRCDKTFLDIKRNSAKTTHKQRWVYGKNGFLSGENIQYIANIIVHTYITENI